VWVGVGVCGSWGEQSVARWWGYERTKFRRSGIAMGDEDGKGKGVERRVMYSTGREDGYTRQRLH
jgi:chromosome condensin MukBEF complex kleisin-like MukF subunit